MESKEKDTRDRVWVGTVMHRVDGADELAKLLMGINTSIRIPIYWTSHDGEYKCTFIACDSSGKGKGYPLPYLESPGPNEGYDDHTVARMLKFATNDAISQLQDMPVPTMPMILKAYGWKIGATNNPSTPASAEECSVARLGWLAGLLLRDVVLDGTEFAARCLLVRIMVADSLMAQFAWDHDLGLYRSPYNLPLYSGKELDKLNRARGACVFNLGGVRLEELRMSLVEALAMPA